MQRYLSALLLCSRTWQLSTEEQKAIVDGFTSPDQIQASGVRLAGQKYFTLSVVGRTIQAKKAVRSASVTTLLTTH